MWGNQGSFVPALPRITRARNIISRKAPKNKNPQLDVINGLAPGPPARSRTGAGLSPRKTRARAICLASDSGGLAVGKKARLESEQVRRAHAEDPEPLSLGGCWGNLPVQGIPLMVLVSMASGFWFLRVGL